MTTSNGSLVCVLLTLVVIEAAPQSALVTQLPGFDGTFPSKHYAGYVTLDGNPPKNYFYYFVVSENKPLQDPVVLWLNGGPGCSSFDGFVFEHGPFNFQPAETPGSLPTLHLNPYSWSKVSNIIYLDSPAGVGFSYSPNTSLYVTGDTETAQNTHSFLLKWFELYPEYQANRFFIAGESYAGVYVPTLASEVVKGIDAGAKPLINFKGYLVGNGVADHDYDENGFVPFTYGMGLISDQMFKEAVNACKGIFHDPNTEACANALNKIDIAVDGLNIYNILEPCYHAPGSNEEVFKRTNLPPSFKQLGVTEKPMAVRKRIFGRGWPLRASVKEGLVPMWSQLMANEVPCVDDTVATTWLNDVGVRKAIHAAAESVSGPWELCASFSKLRYYHDAGSMIIYHKNLTTRGYRALIYSGDHDMCVPYTGTEAWTASLGYKIIDEWRPWNSNDQVAGYVQGYDKNLSFLTVKGAGHTVPEYKPREALDFYSRWLEGKSI
ncbi:Peptidase S10, serine carboxypeptidase [Dillenia turbinata]|uniref:Carboxypeptidase n=1 Tax=Dillenia turbinata TaxID=194707 RepID=A0AAN8UMY9_9MAGN